MRGSTCSRNEAEVMGYRRMVDESVCDHFGKGSDTYNIRRKAIAKSNSKYQMCRLGGRDCLYRSRGEMANIAGPRQEDGSHVLQE